MYRGEHAAAPWMRSRAALQLAVWTVAVAAVAAVGAAFGPDSWYERIEKPSFTPPGWIFGVVWPLLYASMVVFAWRLLRAPPSGRRRWALRLLGLQLLLNALWSPLFFGAHQAGFAFVDVCLLWSCVVALCLIAAPVDRIASIVFVPYVLWLSFALILNGMILMLN